MNDLDRLDRARAGRLDRTAGHTSGTMTVFLMSSQVGRTFDDPGISAHPTLTIKGAIRCP